MTTTFKCNLLLKTPLRLMNNFGFVWRYFCVTMSKKEMSPSYWFWWNCRMGGSIATICCWVMSLVHYREKFWSFPLWTALFNQPKLRRYPRNWTRTGS